MKAKTGHLAHSYLNLKQTDKVRQSLSKSAKRHANIRRLQPVELNWTAQRERRRGFE